MAVSASAALRRELRLHIRIGEGLHHLGVPALHDRRGRLGRHHDALPGADLEPLHPRLVQRRDVGQHVAPLQAGHRKRLEPLFPEVRKRGIDRLGGELRLAADQVGERRCAAPVGNVHRFQTVCL
jgi:hypothetical protein